METTKNYKLNKPDYAEAADIKVLNDNMDTLDETLTKVGTKPVPLHYDTRVSSANVSVAGDASIRLLQASSSMSTGKPERDGYIIHFDWDNTGGWSAQLSLGSNGTLSTRGMDAGTWGNWYDVASIAESGEKYIRFTNGLQLCWGSYYGTKAFTAWGGIMSTNNYDPKIKFEKTFAKAPFVYGQTFWTDGVSNAWIESMNTSKTEINSIEVLRGGSAGTYSFALMYLAIGQWK